jgi:hypothetical protein
MAKHGEAVRQTRSGCEEGYGQMGAERPFGAKPRAKRANPSLSANFLRKNGVLGVRQSTFFTREKQTIARGTIWAMI